MSMAHPSGRAVTPSGPSRSVSSVPVSIPCVEAIDDTEYLVWQVLEALHTLEERHVPQEEITAMQRRLDRLKKETVQ